MSPDAPPPKATLFCPECPHRSHVTGDWHLVETAHGVRLVCPNCLATATVRPAARLAGRTPSR
jgi:hypothetical protein